MNSICSNNFQTLFKKTLGIAKLRQSTFIVASLALSVLWPLSIMTASWAQQTTRTKVLSAENPNIPKSQTINLNGVVFTLVGILKDKNVETRVNAIRALGGMGTQAQLAVPALVTALKDPQSRVRYSAAIALANIGAEFKTAVPSIVDALTDESKLLRLDAASALTNIGYELKQKAPELSKSDLEKIINHFDKALQIVEKFQSNFSRNTIRNIRTSRNALQQERSRR